MGAKIKKKSKSQCIVFHTNLLISSFLLNLGINDKRQKSTLDIEDRHPSRFKNHYSIRDSSFDFASSSKSKNGFIYKNDKKHVKSRHESQNILEMS